MGKQCQQRNAKNILYKKKAIECSCKLNSMQNCKDVIQIIATLCRKLQIKQTLHLTNKNEFNKELKNYLIN